MFPEYSRSERTADLWIHLLALAFAAGAAVAMAVIAAGRSDPVLNLSLALYGVGLTGTIVASALYHLTGPSPRKEVYRRIDHAAIFVMIAGSYTPVMLLGVGQDRAVPLLLLIWTAALIGALVKLVFPRRFERLSLALYLLLGWAFLLVVDDVIANTPTAALVLLGVGGLLYSGGVLFHLRRSMRFHNAIWHACVLAAAACHYSAIVWGIAT